MSCEPKRRQPGLIVATDFSPPLFPPLSEHSVLFLMGNSSCYGLVGIEHAGKIFFLSGSTETWNQACADTVCRQMHCGEALAAGTCPRDLLGTREIWNRSYRCSANATDLFDCERATASPDHHETIATVECSGNVQGRVKD